jgi:hypothetical protein
MPRIRLNDRLYPCAWQSFLSAALLLVLVVNPVSASEENRQASVTGIPVPFSGLVTIEGDALTQGPGVGQGRWTLVMIWVTNCHICREQKPKISAFHDARKHRDAEVFGIAMDGAGKLSKVKKFIDKYGVTFPTFVGDMMSVMKDYEKLTNEPFQGTPTYLLFNPEGELKGNNPGPITIASLERFIERHSENR